MRTQLLICHPGGPWPFYLDSHTTEETSGLSLQLNSFSHPHVPHRSSKLFILTLTTVLVGVDTSPLRLDS